MTQQESKIYEPVIISASRATDIAGFFGDWFIDKWQKGQCNWTNPFNGKKFIISLKKTRAAVFWTKYPKNFLKHLDYIKQNIPIFYFQHSLNDYDNEGIELNIPPKAMRIEVFKTLSESIGKERVIWRFDPLILTDKNDIQRLLDKIESIGDELKNHTQKLVFSFVDIYKRTAFNLRKQGIVYTEWDEEKMINFAQQLSELNTKKAWGFELATCTEEIELKQYGIKHNKCVDDELILRLLAQKIQKQDNSVKDEDEELLNHLGCEFGGVDLFGKIKFIKTSEKNIKDKGQRRACGCVQSKDIGAYNTCLFGCVYCYANDILEKPKINFKRYKAENENL